MVFTPWAYAGHSLVNRFPERSTIMPPGIAERRFDCGQPNVQSERGLGGGGAGTANWAPGRWVFRNQVLAIPPRTPPGDYQLSVELYDSRSRSSPPLTAGPSVGSTELILGRVRVR